MISFQTKTFNELTTTELYQLLKLREDVFIIEQNCVYQDLDTKDYQSLHVLGTHNNILVAYTRLLPVGTSYKSEPSIGRVLTHIEYRKLGYGKLLMEYSIKQLQLRFKATVILISAQLYLKKFYQELGFVAEGETYMEDNIPHVAMRFNFTP